MFALRHVKSTLQTHGENLLLGTLFTALLLNVAYLLWPVPPQTVVISPPPATLKNYAASAPVLVEAAPDTGEDKTYLLVDPTDKSGKAPTVIRAGRHGEHGDSKKAFAGKVNLNTATLSQLQLLPGIGPKMAQRILAYRKQHGSFSNLNQLMEISGIGPKKLEKLLPHTSL